MGGVGLVAALAVTAWTAQPLRADDLTTCSGQTFHAVRPVRVEPDGVTWEHAGGVVKVDFSDSPDNVRTTYHYDPARAVAYHDARAQAWHEAEEHTRQTLQANEERQRTHAQALARSQGTAASDAPATTAAGLPAEPPRLVYRHGLADTVQAAARALATQDDARKAQAAVDARNGEGLLGDPQLWRLVPGVGSKPVPLRMDQPNVVEYRASLHHTSDKSLAESSLQDEFFNGIYTTKSYYEDVDRAAAFARGTPLK